MPVEIRAPGGVVNIEQKKQIVNVQSDKYSIDANSLLLDGGIPYFGPYTVTPTTEEQVLNVSMKTLSTDIIIEPIPQNYGLVSWNGAALTVS